LDTPKCRSLFDFVYKPVRMKRIKAVVYKKWMHFSEGKKTDFNFSLLSSELFDYVWPRKLREKKCQHNAE